MRARLTAYAAVVAVALVASACTTTKPQRGETVAQPKTAIGPVKGEWALLPMPRRMDVTGGFERFQKSASTLPTVPDSVKAALAEAVESVAPNGAGPEFFFGYAFLVSPSFPVVAVEIDPARVPNPQGYELSVQPDGVAVAAHDEAGLFYATQTLKQIGELARRNGCLPACRIADWPDFPNRGVMLDVARCKVPEMSTLYELVDLFASWKYNQIQLYTEHTFAYRGHHVVWEDASPMTPEQVRALDAYCKARFVQLVPNQNSFGHMNRWLSHPEYADLAETPDGSDLCPVDPRSIELLRSMYAYMLPNFSSPFFNVGCDETWTLGKGRSKQACAERGEGRVYLEFLMKIRGLLAENGKRMQFWADIINNHPELIPELPKDITAMEWGYDAGHPYPEHAKRFHDNGVAFYVVPGTSSWNSLLGRTDNALANLREAAQYGRDNGGEGYLVTDWGDGGHWQFLPVSFVPFAYGAALSWCFDANRGIDPAKAADRWAFRDDAGVMGSVACDLGNAHALSGVKLGNNTVYYALLQHGFDKPLDKAGLGDLDAADLERTIAGLDAALARIDAARMDRSDADLIKAEFRMDAALAKFACRLGLARLQNGGAVPSALPKDARAALAAELEPQLPEYRRLWLARNRSGGLKDSAGILENILAVLER